MPEMDKPQQPYVKADGSIGVRPAVFDDEGVLIPDPSWIEFLKEANLGQQYDEKLVEGPIPMVLNLGEFFTGSLGAIGYATVYEMNDGRKRISILLNAEASQGLGNLAKVFELRAIGFAGVEKRSKGGE